MIEVKKPEEEFPLYDPNILMLKVIKYVEGEQYDFKKLDLLPTQTIEINKKEDTVNSFEI